MIELEKSYDASKVETRIYKQWLDSGYFNPDNLPEQYKDAETYSMTLPPPNVTGVLHMGHAFEDTIQDTMIRYQRMQGKRTLWIPGTDHAAIATQAKFEKEHYKKTEKSRHDYSREDFFSMIQEFALDNQKNIISQLHKLGLSLDWDRLAFTLDKDRESAVRTAFKEMHDSGLIYRKNRVVNWDPKGQTTVSDDEIEYEETKAKLYTFRYSKDFPIPIATTRPETKFGDTAVAVNPHDERYQQYVGQEFDLQFCGTNIHIKVIADETVEKDFGTGALGVTPAHSMVDYELGQRHDLPMKQVINEFAKMTVDNEQINGKKTSEARDITIQLLKESGLLEKEEDIIQNLSKAQRTGGVIEPLPKLQWFIDVNKKFKAKTDKLSGIKTGEEVSLKEIMKRVVESKQIEILPERFEKTYYHWIDNLRDWCISRQIIYGHRIPAWHPVASGSSEQFKVSIENINDPQWTQDTDTLDTWFSSGLWTFSTLGWPQETIDLKTYHPTSAIIPGYEILFFWVARMILMSGFLLGDVPFKKVFLHGMVRDKQGRKFSKSLNNGIDPLEMIDKYGTDALRMALVFSAAPGNDPIFDEQKVKGMKHFANKLWNIARYILVNTDSTSYQLQATSLEPKTDADKDILKKLDTLTGEVSKYIEDFQLHLAAQGLYQFVWYEFADVYIEASKSQLEDEKLKENTQKILLHTLIMIIKLLHPFIPFITEEIWSMMQKAGLLTEKNLLLISPWPK